MRGVGGLIALLILVPLLILIAVLRGLFERGMAPLRRRSRA
jgi:hypothetical protein